MTRSSDRFIPTAKVTAATPTTRAPRVIAARTGMCDAGRDTESRRDADRQAESQPAKAAPVSST